MKGKAGKGMTAVMFILLLFAFMGCGIREGRKGMYSQAHVTKGGNEFLWYEEHKLSDGKYFSFGIDADGNLHILSDAVQNW